MAKVRLPYYRVKRNGRGFWEPSAKMKRFGFEGVPCGPDGPDAWRIAREWNDRWQRVLRGAEPMPGELRRSGVSPDAPIAMQVYPPGSLGEAFARYRKTPEWSKKAIRTREEWERAWKRIDPVFGDMPPNTVTLELISDWRQGIEVRISLREAHRALKIWRALWKVAAALQYCVRPADPSLGVKNTAARGRSATWIEGEAVRLVKQAWRAGYRGLAAVLAVMWDSQMSPGDVRSLRAEQVVLSDCGAEIVATRAKTETAVLGLLGPRATAVLRLYLADRASELHPSSPLFLNRSGAPYSKDTLGDDFRDVRAIVFGKTERRQMLDFRRSGAVESIAGGARPADLAHAMGNTLSASNALFETYVPSNRTTIHQVHEARKIGRRAIRKEGKRQG
jgi:hypothetical protein